MCEYTSYQHISNVVNHYQFIDLEPIVTQLTLYRHVILQLLFGKLLIINLNNV